MGWDRSRSRYVWVVAAILCLLASLYIWQSSLRYEDPSLEHLLWPWVTVLFLLASLYLWHRSNLLAIHLSPYISSGGAIMLSLASFYILITNPFTPHTFLTFRLLASMLAIVATVNAYRKVGGIEWMIWLSPVIVELAFVPRLVISILFDYTFPYPQYASRALIYPPLFIAGWLLSRRRYANYLKGGGKLPADQICEVAP